MSYTLTWSGTGISAQTDGLHAWLTAHAPEPLRGTISTVPDWAVYAGLAAIGALVLWLMASLFSRKNPERAPAPRSTPRADPPRPAAQRQAAPARQAAPSAPARSAASASARPSAPSTDTQIIADMASLAAWRTPQGERAVGRMESGAYLLEPFQAARSVATIRVEPRAKYRLHFRVAAAKDSDNGRPNNFYIGPLFLDSRGEILQWFRVQPPIAVSEGERSGAIDVEAPAKAHAACVSMQGNYAPNRAEAGTGVIAFKALRLIRAP